MIFSNFQKKKKEIIINKLIKVLLRVWSNNFSYFPEYILHRSVLL